MTEIADATDWLEDVRTYTARFCDVDNHGETPLQTEMQALSAQHMADTLRILYGDNVRILEICEIRNDWN